MELVAALGPSDPEDWTIGRDGPGGPSHCSHLLSGIAEITYHWRAAPRWAGSWPCDCRWARRGSYIPVEKSNTEEYNLAMWMKREVGQKGQVVLPKDIREYLNIKPGTKVLFEIRGGEVILKPERTGKEFVDYFCRTSRKLKKSVSAKAIKKTIQKQYDLR